MNMTTLNCSRCGADFERASSLVKRERRKYPNRRVYCSKECNGKSLRTPNSFSYDATSFHDLELAALMLYWGEGTKGRKRVELTNSDHRMIRVFCRFLREVCQADESKITGRLQIHEGNSVKKALDYWQQETGIETSKVLVSVRPQLSSKRHNRYPFGIFSVRFNSVGVREKIEQRIEEIAQEMCFCGRAPIGRALRLRV